MLKWAICIYHDRRIIQVCGKMSYSGIWPVWNIYIWYTFAFITAVSCYLYSSNALRLCCIEQLASAKQASATDFIREMVRKVLCTQSLATHTLCIGHSSLEHAFHQHSPTVPYASS